MQNHLETLALEAAQLAHSGTHNPRNSQHLQEGSTTLRSEVMVDIVGTQVRKRNRLQERTLERRVGVSFSDMLHRAMRQTPENNTAERQFLLALVNGLGASASPERLQKYYNSLQRGVAYQTQEAREAMVLALHRGLQQVQDDNTPEYQTLQRTLLLLASA